MTPKSPSYAESDAKVTPKWLQSHLSTLKVLPKLTPKSHKSFKSSFTFFPIICKSGSFEASKPRSLAASRCLGGNREAKSIGLQHSLLAAPPFLLTALRNWRLSQPSSSPLHAPTFLVLVSVPILATSCALHVPARADRPTGPPTVLRYGQVKHTQRWRDKDTRTDPVVPGRPCIHIHKPS